MPNQETPITNPEKTKKADKQNRLSRNERTARDLQIEL